jgi:hypothetical protein
LPTPAPTDGSVAPEMIRNYVEHYDGGSCFFVAPVVILKNQAVIEGLGASASPFDAFDKEFGRTIGFEAKINVQQVTEQQCPAVAFLAQLRGERARAPHLDIDQDHLRIGETLRGLVDHYSSAGNIDLVLVSDAGRVQNLSSQLKPGTGSKTFDIPTKGREVVEGRQPQLLIALAGPSPIDALRPGQPTDAQQLFPRVLSEAARSGKSLSASVRYFTLER